MKRVLFGLIISLTLSNITAQGQNCTLQLSGQIIDKGNHMPLSYTTIRLLETGQGSVADSSGNFTIQNICTGGYHVVISHIGFETENFFVNMTNNTQQTFILDHDEELLNEVVINGKQDVHSTEVNHVIGQEKLADNGNKNLADMLEGVTGVSIIKNGSGISKPVIHGLSGNRVTILNNGLVQAGQQWGVDHAPEIDPLSANQLTLIKGVAGIEYSGGSSGGILLVEPGMIPNDPHIHGGINYIFQSNGLGHTVNAKFEKSGSWASWRVVCTLKNMGDHRSPNYYLTNTGSKQGSIALQAQKKFSEKLILKSYYSFFHTELGILRGAQVGGNIADLEQAIGKNRPYYTEDNFSYSINAPRQTVNHHLMKLESSWFISTQQTMTIKYGGQLNQRQEYDVRRGGRSDRPALKLGMQSQYIESAYEHIFSSGYELKTGLQYTYNQNKNDNELTGILPLIPDYYSHTTGGFVTIKKNTDELSYEIGGRYDAKFLNVATISTDLPRRIEYFNHRFQNYSVATGISRFFNNNINTQINIGYNLRTPEINELYSNGLHQGVSGIERGNRELLNEKSLKMTLSSEMSFSKKISFHFIGFAQRFENYIYLQPNNEFEVTIRGAFPVFNYAQTDAIIYGTDLVLTLKTENQLLFNFAYAFLIGRDLKYERPLINMPANNLALNCTYTLKNKGIFSNNHVSIQPKYVFQQNQYNKDQDFLIPPDGYFLLNAKASTSFKFKKSILKINLRVENALNTVYRDYLNRLRYFADENGINLIVGCNYSF